MRKYRIHYEVEVNDASTDRSLVVEARSPWDTRYAFEQKVRVYKRITKIEEEHGQTVI